MTRIKLTFITLTNRGYQGPRFVPNDSFYIDMLRILAEIIPKLLIHIIK
jgi:hypothetical protein